MYKLFVLFGILAFLSACDTHQHGGDLSLDNGQKWKVNEEMKPFVRQGMQILDNYVQEKDTDYKGLAAALKSQNEQLVKSCTMDGKAHDELHNWLHPHMKLVDQLDKTNNEAEAGHLVAQLQDSYALYDRYFE